MLYKMEDKFDESVNNVRIKTRRAKGGLKTMPFIIGNEALETVASYGILPNMTFYLMKEYMMEVTSAQNLLFYWSSTTNFLPIVGAFLADSYFGRFLVIGIGSIFSFLGSFVLWLTAMMPQARPPPCNIQSQACKSATPAQYTLLISSFLLMSIGAGGVRPCSLAFGADQFDKKRYNADKKRVLETFFIWYYAAALVSVLIAITGIVYIQDHIGWKLGFGIPVILMFLSILFFFLASPYYIKQNVRENIFGSFVQVIVVAIKNWKLAYPATNSGYHQNKDSEFLMATNKLRFLNKACIIRHPEDVKPDGVAVNKWNLCTIEQVEELKSLIRVIPIWSTGIMVAVNFSQSSFPLLQAQSMNRHITKTFEIPAGSFSMFLIISLITWLALYDRVILPIASRIRGKQVRIGPKVRMGIGIFFSCMAMLVSGFVENVRRKKAIEQRILDTPKGIVTMSAMWLVPQYVLKGIAEAFSLVAQNEFYYSEFPKNMSSIATAMFGLGVAFGNLLASVILSNVDKFTKGKGSWVSSNINKGHYDNYYWLLAIMTGINLFYFMVVSWAYGPYNAEENKKIEEEGDAHHDLL